MLKLLEKLLDSVLAFIIKRKKINPNARCPACGHRNGQIRYDPQTQKVLHSCNVCTAIRPENPRMPAQSWDFIGKILKANEGHEDEVRALFDRANAPVKEPAHAA